MQYVLKHATLKCWPHLENLWIRSGIQSLGNTDWKFCPQLVKLIVDSDNSRAKKSILNCSLLVVFEENQPKIYIRRYKVDKNQRPKTGHRALIGASLPASGDWSSYEVPSTFAYSQFNIFPHTNIIRTEVNKLYIKTYNIWISKSEP